MADTSRKRSRKSKLVPRQCNLDSDDEDGDLEEELLKRFARKASSTIDIKDEPTTSSCPITEMYATETFTEKAPMIHISEPPMHINVKVEVERCDETNLPCTQKTTEQTVYVDQGAFWRKYKLKKFYMCNSMIVNAADKIKEHSTNIADKILDVAVRNTTGHIIKGALLSNNTIQTIGIQNVLDQWKDWQSKHFLRDGPLFYKCYVCKQSWWYLEDFKQHIQRHTLLNISVENQSHHEINIIAYAGTFAFKADIFTNGKCGRCGQGYYYHSVGGKEPKTYSCHGCSKEFHTCLSLGFHVSNCPTLGLPKTRITCQICRLEIPTINNYDHLVTVHSVRSDIPIITRRCQYNTCEVCNERYINKNQHVCATLTYTRCKYCFRGFPTKFLVDLHLEGYFKTYQCPICDQSIDWECMKYEHMLTHSDKYAIVFKCVLCIKFVVFLSNTGFIKHMKSAHRNYDFSNLGFSTQIMIPKSCLHTYFDSFPVEVNNKGICEVNEESTAEVKKDVQIETGDDEENVQVKTEIESEKEEIVEDIPEIQIKSEPVEPVETEVFSEQAVKEEPLDEEEQIETSEYYFSHDVVVKEEFNQDDIDVYEDDIIKLDMSIHDFEIKEENNESQDTESNDNENRSDFEEDEPSRSKKKLYRCTNEDDIIKLDMSINNFEIKEENNESQDTESNDNENRSDFEEDESIRSKKKLYRCTKCGFEAIHRIYRIHVSNNCNKTFVSVNKFSCTQCGESFKTLGKYLTHLTLHGYEALTCPECLGEFNSHARFVSHVMSQVKQSFVKIKAFTGEGPHNKAEYQCSKCSSVVETKKFFVHWESHLSLSPTHPGKSLYENNVFSTPAVVELLGRLHKRTKQCCYCHRTFTRFNECKRHHIEHLLTDAYDHKDQYRELRCQICADGFKTAEKYRHHMRDHASLPVYRCDMCNKTFSDSSNFTKHKKVHNFKVFVCDLCRKKFQSKVGLVKHLEMHMNTEPIACKICFKTFHFDSAYRKHMKYHHNKEGVGYPCVICNIRFNSLKHKWRHMWEVHKERKTVADCPICKKSFRIFSEVRSHMKNEHFTKLSVGKLRNQVQV